MTNFTQFSSSEAVLATLEYVDVLVRWAMARARKQGVLPDGEFRGLYISEAEVEDLLAQPIGQTLWLTPGVGNGHGEDWPGRIAQSRRQWQAKVKNSPFQQLVRAFDLSEVEADILLIALAPELEPRYERLYAFLQNDITKLRPTIGLILNLLSDSYSEKMAWRGLLADSGRLLGRQLLYRFYEGPRRDPPWLEEFLRPAASLAFYLAGHLSLDNRLAGKAGLHDTAHFTPSPWQDGSRLTTLRKAAIRPAIFAFLGGYGAGKQEMALTIAQSRQEPLLTVNLAALNQNGLGWYDGLRLALRDGQLYGATLYLTQLDSLLSDHRPPEALLDLLWAYPGAIILGSEKSWQARLAGRPNRPIFTIELTMPDYESRLEIWQHCLSGRASGSDLHHLATHFQFTPGQIADAVATAQDIAHWQGQTMAISHLLQASRAHSNQNLADLAQKIMPRYTWDDIVLPADTRQQLQEIVNRARQRPTVQDKWGFGRKLSGRGTTALFTGEPGTGKTMSADIIANELGLDLYKVDLSTLVSKYIGETEKNLDKVFREANTSNAILFFDEADAIFGKRSEVKDSHDRYANLEISYLLQRMEAYDGIAILATNMRANLDEAFTRRFGFITDFPFPEQEYREAIWRIHFPAEAPLSSDIDIPLLAERYRIAGGNIRNIVLAAAFLAAHAGQPIGMPQLFHAARREYQKMGRLIEETLFE